MTRPDAGLVERLRTQWIGDGLSPIDVKDAASAIEALTTDRDRLAARVRELREALGEVREWIKRAPDDTWGENYMGDPDVPGGTKSWPLKDELLHNLARALADPEEGK